MARNFDQQDTYKQEFDARHFKRLLTYLKPYRWVILLTLAIMIMISVSEMAGPILIQQAIDHAIPDSNLGYLNLIGIMYLLLRIVMAVGMYFRTRLMNRTGQSMIYNMRKELYNHLQKLSLRFFDGRPAGKIMTRLTSDIENLNELLTSGIVQVINDMITLVLIMGIMLYMNVRLALYTFVIMPILVFIATKLRNYVRDNWREVRKKRSAMNAFLQESISGIRTIQAFTQENDSQESFKMVNDDYTVTQIKATKTSLLFRPSVELTAAIGTCIVYWVGAYYVLDGKITTGILVAFFSYVGRFWEPISRMSNFYNTMLVAMASAERVFTILDTEPEISNSLDATKMGVIDGSVEFNGVHFAYDEGTPVLKGINFQVEPGQSIAIVGPTGAGKSTIINLIPRFYDVTEGKILIDGRDVRDVEVDSLRNQMSIVLQDPLIFSGTIRENIRYGKLDATDDEIIEAAKAANAHEFIMEFDSGYDTDVQERGSRLSVGQRQLISFARAIIANPRILILDEATSSIDTKTEKLIQDAIQKVLLGRTSFIIAHRLSTIRNADKIIVIDDGCIVESGSHEELMDQRGVYFNLNKAQYHNLQRASTVSGR